MSNPTTAITIEAEHLLTEARGLAKLEDFGASEYEPVLQAWVRDLNGPQLNDFGRAFLRRLMVRDLVRRLRVVDTLARHPQIAEVKIPTILFISGFPRTGTTLLHNVLALHPSSRALLRWELMDPTPPPEAASYATDPRIARMQKSIEPLRGGVLERMHWVNADEPEECTWGYWDGTGLLGRGCGQSMPTWARLINTSSALPTLEGYRKLVQLLLYRNPLPAGGVLVLKNPAITWNLDELTRVFPEAQLVITHRDPYRSLSSMCTVLDAINGPFAVAESPLRDDGKRGEDSLLAWYRVGAARLERFDDAHPGRALHVPYEALMADSLRTARLAYERVGVSLGDEFPGRVEAFLQKQREGHRAAPPATYESYGYDYDAVWDDPVIARYCARHGLAREHMRIADVKRSGSAGTLSDAGALDAEVADADAPDCREGEIRKN